MSRRLISIECLYTQISTGLWCVVRSVLRSSAGRVIAYTLASSSKHVQLLTREHSAARTSPPPQLAAADTTICSRAQCSKKTLSSTAATALDSGRRRRRGRWGEGSSRHRRMHPLGAVGDAVWAALGSKRSRSMSIGWKSDAVSIVASQRMAPTASSASGLLASLTRMAESPPSVLSSIRRDAPE